jgi:hypothetical protein
MAMNAMSMNAMSMAYVHNVSVQLQNPLPTVYLQTYVNTEIILFLVLMYVHK